MPRLAACCLLLAALVAWPAPPTRAQDLAGYPVLRFEASARAAALGGSFAAVDDGDVNALFYNPALLSERTHQRISASYLNHLSDLNAGFLAYARHLDGLGTLGAGLRFLSYGSFEGYDENAAPTGDFGAADVALTVSGARAVTPRLRLGAGVHLLYASLDDASATGLGLDFGARYRIPAQQLTLSASVNHLGTSLSNFYEETVDLPLDLRLGVAKRLRYLPLLLSVTAYDLQHLGDAPDADGTLDAALRHVALGGELTLGEYVRARLGYSHRRRQELGLETDGLDLAGLSMGVGLRLDRFGVDYAYNSWSSYGGLHQFTLQAQL